MAKEERSWVVPNHSQNLWGKVLVPLRIIIKKPLIIYVRKGYHTQSIYAFLICRREHTYFKNKSCITCFQDKKGNKEGRIHWNSSGSSGGIFSWFNFMHLTWVNQVGAQYPCAASGEEVTRRRWIRASKIPVTYWRRLSAPSDCRGSTGWRHLSSQSINWRPTVSWFSIFLKKSTVQIFVHLEKLFCMVWLQKQCCMT